jgi:hypothetical protein
MAAFLNDFAFFHAKQNGCLVALTNPAGQPAGKNTPDATMR